MSEPSAWVFTVRIDCLSQNRLYASRNHWHMRKLIKELRDTSRAAFDAMRIRHNIPIATGKRRVTWERILGPRQHEFDEPNFIGGLKPVLDGLVRSGLLVDDRPKFYVGRYGQVHTMRTEGPALRLAIEEWSDEADQA